MAEKPGHIVYVLSSNGKDHYPVTMEGGKAVACAETCGGWKHRQTCRHLAEAERLHAETQTKPKK